MFTRDKAFYDIVEQGLAYLGYYANGEHSALEVYLQDMFANKYNAEKTYAQVGFSLNPNIPIKPTYEQIEASIRPYTMAAYVDIDSDGPTKSTDGLSYAMGELPTFKHEITLSRKMLREQMMLADTLGKVTDGMMETVMQLFFNSIDDLLGGNYNTMLYQRHQIVSNFGKLVINSNNNPLGYTHTLQFDGIVNSHKFSETLYTKSGDTVTESSNIATLAPLKKMKKIKRDAINNDFAPNGMHWEVSRETWEDFISLPYIRNTYINAHRPDVTNSTMIATLAGFAEDAAIKAWIESVIGARIDVIDAQAAVEKFDKTTKKIAYTNLKSFNEGVFVLVPDGIIGDVQFGRPIVMDTPGARNAYYDGGRTLIRNVFEDENMIQVVKSEVTGLVVPNKTRWMYYYTVK